MLVRHSFLHMHFKEITKGRPENEERDHRVKKINGRRGNRCVEIINVSVTRMRKVGRYHLMDAQNPVYIAVVRGR